MTMVYASPPPPRRARIRDSQDEVETHVYVRPAPHAWDRVMVLQIMTDLDRRRRIGSVSSVRRIATSPVPSAGESNVFLQPWTAGDPPLPWRTSPQTANEPAATLDGTVVRERARAYRSKMPWVLFLAAFGLAFGIGQDRVLRAELASELRIASVRTLAVLETSAMRLGRQVAELR